VAVQDDVLLVAGTATGGTYFYRYINNEWTLETAFDSEEGLRGRTVVLNGNSAAIVWPEHSASFFSVNAI